jgi:hypothetical protein
LEWCRADQLEYYRKFEQDVFPEKIYLIIGFGGRPLRPSFMFCLPLEEIHDCEISPDILEKFERDPVKRFDYERGLLV